MVNILFVFRVNKPVSSSIDWTLTAVFTIHSMLQMNKLCLGKVLTNV